MFAIYINIWKTCFFLQDVSVIYKPLCEVSEQIFFFFEYKLSITVPSKSLQRGHESQSVKAHTLPSLPPSPSPPLSLWLFQAGINRKESANETNCVVCVLWKEQPVLSWVPAHGAVTGWLLSGVLFVWLLWLELGKVSNSPPSPTPSFSPGHTLVVFKLRVAEPGWEFLHSAAGAAGLKPVVLIEA